MYRTLSSSGVLHPLPSHTWPSSPQDGGPGPPSLPPRHLQLWGQHSPTEGCGLRSVQTPWRQSSRYSPGLGEAVSCLLEQGASPQAVLRDNTLPPVLLAAYGGHSEVSDILTSFLQPPQVLAALVDHRCSAPEDVSTADFTVVDPSTGETVLHLVLKVVLLLLV